MNLSEDQNTPLSLSTAYLLDLSSEFPISSLVLIQWLVIIYLLDGGVIAQ